ncbi:MAG: ABC transporter permease, partial [Acidimicrobiia bacterium]
MDRHRAQVSGAARRSAWVLVALVPVVFLAVFFVYPVGTIMARGLWSDGALDLREVGDVVGDGGLRRVAWFTVWQAVVSTVLTLAIGLPGACLFARFDFPGRRLLHAAIIVPFVLPTVVVGSAFLALLGPRGPLAFLGIDGTVWAILLAHVFFNYAVVVRTVGGLWSHLDPRREEAARMLGASRARVFLHVTLPALRPAI